MAKRKTKPGRYDFPPDIFWISPEGLIRSVIGHLTALRAHPERYGLHLAPRTEEEVQSAMDRLFSEGWVRGRFSHGVFSFQMDRPRGVPMGNAYDLVLKYADDAREVDVDFWIPRYSGLAKTLPAKEFMQQRFPARWDLGAFDEEPGL